MPWLYALEYLLSKGDRMKMLLLSKLHSRNLMSKILILFDSIVVALDLDCFLNKVIFKAFMILIGFQEEG